MIRWGGWSQPLSSPINLFPALRWVEFYSALRQYRLEHGQTIYITILIKEAIRSLSANISMSAMYIAKTTLLLDTKRWHLGPILHR